MPKRLSLVLALATTVAFACVPPEKPEGLGKRWDPTTVMGELQERGQIRVAVSPNSPLKVEGEPGPYERFTMEFATFLADILSVELVEVEVPIDSLQTGIDTGDVDLAFPLRPVTERAVRQQAFGDPIFVAHQRAFLPLGGSLENATTFCALLDPDTGFDPSAQDESLRVVTERDPAACTAALDRQKADAILALDVLLASISETFPGEIAGDQLTTVGLSPQLKTGAQAWVDYVNSVLRKWVEEGHWATAYEAHFGDSIIGTEEPRPPDLTVEEAAALFPS